MTAEQQEIYDIYLSIIQESIEQGYSRVQWPMEFKELIYESVKSGIFKSFHRVGKVLEIQTSTIHSWHACVRNKRKKDKVKEKENAAPKAGKTTSNIVDIVTEIDELEKLLSSKKATLKQILIKEYNL